MSSHEVFVREGDQSGVMELEIDPTIADEATEDEEIAYLDLDIEEWELVIDGLVTVGGNPNRTTGREERAWELIEAIHEGLGVPMTTTDTE